MPQVLSSHIEGDIETGVGIQRHCDLGSSGKISEKVTHWDEGRSLGYEISPFGPMQAISNYWSVREVDRDNSIVTVELNYTLKFGPLGRILNSLILSSVMKKRLHSGALMMLKKRVETGQVVRKRRAPDGVPQREAVKA
mgnify:CR=1 FL=1